MRTRGYNRPTVHYRGLLMRIKVLPLLIAGLHACCASSAPLHAGFVQPPDGARPRVWWHWMDGNVSATGIKQDLQWMKRVGLGGIQQFDGSLYTPQVVAERALYGSREWQAHLRKAAVEARRLGLEFAIAGAPGWSETGGPWVRPEQAMKKLVWSTLTVDGGEQNPQLPAPPSVAGPFMDVRAQAEHPAVAQPSLYRDIAVLALPAEAPGPVPTHIISRAGEDVTARLTDGRLADPVALAVADDGATWVTLKYAQPVTLQALTLTIPAARGFGAAPLPEVQLQASADGARYMDIAPVPLSTAPQQTIAFSPYTAAWWRVQLKAAAHHGAPAAGPGVVLPPFNQPGASFPLSELTLHAHARVHRVEEKAGFAAAADYYAIATPHGTHATPLERIVDLTAHLRADGHLDWTAPPGRWTLLRVGYSLTGKQNGPAPLEGTGLEVDKLNAGHVRSYLDEYLGRIGHAVGPGLLGRHGITALLNDSIEAGAQNWTDGMAQQFLARRGYDLTRWLPAVTGRIVENAGASDRFLWDLRHTIGELYADGHYATIAREAHRRGMRVYGEALEDNRPQLGDDMDMRAHTDVPMAAMWTVPADGQPRTTNVADIAGAASVAHVWGQNLVAAESMTAFGHPWAYAPRDLKRTADIEFALGVNRIVIHTSAHQPLDGIMPGVTLAPFLGQYFTRHETWAEQAQPWIDYLARASFMLQQGHHVADVAYFYGEEAPITGLYGTTPNRDVPAGYAYDYVNPTALHQQFFVDGGQLASRGGSRYRLLYLGGASDLMTVATLDRIAALARAGAHIVGRRPRASPSLADEAGAFARLVDELWGPPGVSAGVRTVGRGEVDGTGDLGAALARMKIRPAIALEGMATGIMTTQRHTATHELYFIANTSNEMRAVEGIFRDVRRPPEFWQADSACVAPAPYRRERTGIRVPLRLAPQQSVFVVFPRGAATPGRMARLMEPAPWKTLDSAWQLDFAPGRGAPAGALNVERLQSWTRSATAGIRYFSGTATYRKTFTLGPNVPTHAILDLGDVRDVARVRLNGRQLGTGWKAPYRFALRGVLQRGKNRLEVDITNPWANRLVGDAQPGAQRVTQISGVYAADAPLREAGLLGPVRLLSARSGTCVPGVAARGK